VLAWLGAGEKAASHLRERAASGLTVPSAQRNQRPAIRLIRAVNEEQTPAQVAARRAEGSWRRAHLTGRPGSRPAAFHRTAACVRDAR
jgi:hypothetical protein